MKRAALLLAAVTCLFVFSTLRYGAVLPADLQLAAFGIAAAMLIGYFPWPADTSSAPIPRRWLIPLLALSLWGGLQLVPLPLSILSLLSSERAALLRHLADADPLARTAPLSLKPIATAVYVLRLLICTGFFFIARDLMWRMPRAPWRLAIPPLVAATMQAAIALLQYSAHVPNTFPSGTFVNRDHFSAFVEVALPFAAVGVFEFWMKPHRKAPLACLLAIAGALSFAGIAVSLSRGGFAIALASCTAVILAYAFWSTRGGTRVALSVVILIGAAAGALTFASAGLLDRVNSDDAPLANRLQFWQEAGRVAAANPVFGCGYGAFTAGVYRFRQAVPTRTLDHAHNDPLELLAEGGPVPIALVLFLGWMMLRQILSTLRRPEGARRRAFAFACGLSLLAAIVHSMFDFPLNIPAIAFLFSWIAGASSGLEFVPPSRVRLRG